MTTEPTPKEQDYPLSPVPMDQRKSVWSMGLVLLGFTFFTATMWAGGSVGVAFDFSTMLMVLFGFAFCVTAFIGYQGLEWLSRVAVPAMIILVAVSIRT
jgi:purine-cytosine permease-like protein